MPWSLSVTGIPSPSAGISGGEWAKREGRREEEGRRREEEGRSDEEEEEERKRRTGRRKTETIIPSNSLSVALREQDTKRIWDILEIRSARITNCAKRNEGHL